MDKNFTPMLIGKESEAFDSDDYIFELKMDGIRCLAFIENKKVDLRNKRNLKLLAKFPEMKDLGQYVRADCILDGELYCFHDGIIDFTMVQKRALLNHPFKIQIESNRSKAVFTAFDILFYKNQDVTNLTLLKRKELLQECVNETRHFNRSRYIFKEGIAFYHKTEELNLEGIVAKRIDSIYQVNTKTQNWIKIKYLKDDDFVIVGYIEKKQHISLILAQYDQNELVYIGQVITSLQNLPKVKHSHIPLFDIKNAIWFTPYLAARVKFMERYDNGSLRQPVFVDFIYDKDIKDCQIKRIKNYDKLDLVDS